VERVGSDGGDAFAVVDGRTITAGRIFNSIPFGGVPGSSRDWRLLQHFKGWMIRSLETVFDAGEATIMDFRTSQDAGACFFYVLPVGADRALVECTYFSNEELPEAEYERLLVAYIGGVLKIRDYVILESEKGVIPMTTALRPQEEGAVFHIGAAAGLTKPSSGYTFQFIQEDSACIVASLVRNGVPARPVVRGRFRWYDRILLNVLATGKLTGEEVFSALFLGAGLADVFAFLDNASTPWQDLKIMGLLPKGPFARAAVGEVMAGCTRIFYPLYI
jgi:lycopene beta-cyclase